jgi:hypothetical protein
MLSEVFWVAFITTGSGLIIKLVSMLYKSKCSKCSFCGIEIIRDVVLEEKIDELDLERSKALGNNNIV